VSGHIKKRLSGRIEIQTKPYIGSKPLHIVNEKSGLKMLYDVSDSHSIALKAYFTLLTTECNSIVVHISMSEFVEPF
jgi:hypothetical protein